MKANNGMLVAAAMIFSAIPFVAQAGTAHSNMNKSADWDTCVASLQPAPSKGKTLTPAQEEEVRKCVESKRMNKDKPAPGESNQAPAPVKPDAPARPDQPKPY